MDVAPDYVVTDATDDPLANITTKIVSWKARTGTPKKHVHVQTLPGSESALLSLLLDPILAPLAKHWNVLGNPSSS